jgi:hypothetical protein
MVLCMVELESGLNAKQLSLILLVLNDKKDYIPIEFHSNNTSAIHCCQANVVTYVY